MNIEIGKKALVTTDCWFVAPDGKTYQAVFGTVKGCHTAENTLGIRPNGKSTNWYLEIGNMVIAGCQVHYAIRTDQCNDGVADNWQADAQNGLKEYRAPCRIYMADGI